MTASLDGKSAIVAGAGSGVGRAIARRFAAAGARLMLADTDDRALEETVAGIHGAAAEPARFSHAIDDRLGVTNLIAAAVDALDRIDILVTDMRTTAPGSLLDISPGTFKSALTKNVLGVFLQTRLVAKRMIAQREEDPDFSGAMINISSIAARRTVPELFTYSVSCAALDQLTRSAAASLAPHGIRVNAVAQGALMTAGLREALHEREELRNEVIAVTPLGRIGEAEEAAEAALFLASPAASFITGQIVTVDGGRSVLDPLASPVR